jgi:hypothetical protein
MESLHTFSTLEAYDDRGKEDGNFMDVTEKSGRAGHPIGCPFSRRRLLRLVAGAGLGFLVPPALRPAASLAASGDMCGMDDRQTPVAQMSDMRMIMSLFSSHEKVRRTVEEIPGGIRATTESDDPRVASLLQAHVGRMYQRVNQDRPLTMMSRTLPTLFRNNKRYVRQLSVTPKGVSVTETSSDPQLVAVIRAHGREVTGFVDAGMSSMMQGMMGNGSSESGGMMSGGGMMNGR